MRNALQIVEQPIQSIVGQDQRISTRNQNIANGGSSGDVFDRLCPLVHVELIFAARKTHHAGTRAVAAIHSTSASHEEKNAVWITVHESGNWAVAIFV